MAIATLIQEGDNALKEKDFLQAIVKFTAALKENPKSVNALIKRSMAYQRLSNYDMATKDITDAFTFANEKGKRSEIGLCYFRLSLIYFLQKKYQLAATNISKAKQFDCQDSSLDMWKNKIDFELKKNPPADDEDDDINIPIIDDDNVDSSAIKNATASKAPTSAAVSTASTGTNTANTASTNIDVINKLAPLKLKIREDWYQTNEEIIITIYAKNVKESELEIKFQDKSVTVTFPNGASSEYNYTLDPLYASIDTEKSSFKVYSTKLEIYLVKVNTEKWPSLEHSNEKQAQAVSSEGNLSAPLAYPTSAKKAINWSNFKLDEEEEKNEDPNQFFAQLFKDTDDDSRRAMMKSYTESNGTVLTTSWDEAKNKHFETSPPEGMQEKKWNA